VIGSSAFCNVLLYEMLVCCASLQILTLRARQFSLVYRRWTALLGSLSISGFSKISHCNFLRLLVTVKPIQGTFMTHMLQTTGLWNQYQMSYDYIWTKYRSLFPEVQDSNCFLKFFLRCLTFRMEPQVVAPVTCTNNKAATTNTSNPPTCCHEKNFDVVTAGLAALKDTFTATLGSPNFPLVTVPLCSPPDSSTPIS
jgi:hypothetical protein